MFRANVEDFGEKCSLKNIEWIMKIQKKVALTQLLLHLRHAKGIVSHYFQYNFELFEFRSGSHPTIAQLAERETVEVTGSNPVGRNFFSQEVFVCHEAK